MAISTLSSIRYPLTRAFQILIVLTVKIFSKPTTHSNYKLLPASLAKQPYVIVANHRRAFDPFIICSSLPLRMAVKLLPVSFMTHNVFYDSPLRPLMWLAGCFPARNPHGKHRIFGVEGSVQLLQQGCSIFVFPEGTRVYHQPRGKAHGGIIRIHKAAPHIPLMLCHIEYNKGIKAWLSGQCRIVTYTLVQHPDYEDAEKLMDDVFAL